MQPISVSSTFKITDLQYTYGCPALKAAYACYFYLGHTIRIGVQALVQHSFAKSTSRIPSLHYTSGCPTLSAAYVCMFYLQNYWVTLHLWVRHLTCSLCWFALLSESLGYTSLTYVQPMLGSSTFRITDLQYTYGCPALKAAYACYFYVQNYWVTLHLLVSKL